MRYSSSAGVRSALPMRSHASLKHCAEKNRCATARSKGGAVVMEVSSSPRVDAQRHWVASHRTNVLVYRAIGAGRNESAAAEGTGMTKIRIRRATARDAAVLSMLNADVQAIHAAALPWWFKP